MIKATIARVTACAALCGVLTACPMETKPAPCTTVVVTGCDAFPEVTASRTDSALTRQQVLAYKLARDKLCNTPAPTVHKA